MTIEEFLDQIREKKPPAPPEKVSRLENELGVALPDDYRQFLIRCNGGYVGGALWFQGPTPEGKAADAGVHHIGGFRDENYFSLEKWRAVSQDPGLCIPRELLWVMDDPFGNAICLAVSGAQRGCVFFWDHERVPEAWDGSVESAGHLQLLARSFADFVAGLRPSSED